MTSTDTAPCVLVTGGAGFIGSHLVLALLAHGYRVVVLDNLSTGCAQPPAAVDLVVGDLNDTARVKACLREYQVTAVMHLAGLSDARASCQWPLAYYRHNVAASLSLLQAMQAVGVRSLVFSSSAAVYGEPRATPIAEAHPLAPLTPYGHSKLMVERMLADCQAAWGLRALSLRYFNAAGADPLGRAGEQHDPETHLIPRLLRTLLGQEPPLVLNGIDLPTPDGTAVRDFIHVSDLAEAHLRALEVLSAGIADPALNLGLGRGVSLRQVVEAVSRVTGRTPDTLVGPRHAADPVSLVADIRLARARLGWQPRYDLDSMIRHAWRWACRNPLALEEP